MTPEQLMTMLKRHENLIHLLAENAADVSRILEKQFVKCDCGSPATHSAHDQNVCDACLARQIVNYKIDQKYFREFANADAIRRITQYVEAVKTLFDGEHPTLTKH